MQQIFGLAMAGGFLLVIGALLETTEEMGLPIWRASFRVLVPSAHKTDRGRLWAKLYWVGVVIVVCSAGLLFQGVSIVPLT